MCSMLVPSLCQVSPRGPTLNAAVAFRVQAKYKQLILALGNVRNYRLVTSVLAGTTTPADLATKVC